MMEIMYSVTGLSCAKCVEKVEHVLQKSAGVVNAKVDLDQAQVKLMTSQPVDINQLNYHLAKCGNYALHYHNLVETHDNKANRSYELPEKSLKTYKPLLLIVVFIAMVSIVTQYPFDDFMIMTAMRNFMAGFFIVFSFFKFLNLTGFAEAYSQYDIVAKNWKHWGFIYPFVELLLGLAYLTNVLPQFTNIATIFILGISSIGVIESNLDRRKIKCACLGDVFNLPMSTITIVEDASMVLMAIVMYIVA